jgi:hypothetical protein
VRGFTVITPTSGGGGLAPAGPAGAGLESQPASDADSAISTIAPHIKAARPRHAAGADQGGTIQDIRFSHAGTSVACGINRSVDADLFERVDRAEGREGCFIPALALPCSVLMRVRT